MSYPPSIRKADRFRSAPLPGKIKPVAASSDMPGEMSSAFDRGKCSSYNCAISTCRLEKADRFRSAPRKRKIKQITIPEGSAKETLSTFRSDHAESGTLEPTIAD